MSSTDLCMCYCCFVFHYFGNISSMTTLIEVLIVLQWWEGKKKDWNNGWIRQNIFHYCCHFFFFCKDIKKIKEILWVTFYSSSYTINETAKFNYGICMINLKSFKELVRNISMDVSIIHIAHNLLSTIECHLDFSLWDVEKQHNVSKRIF